MMKKIQVVIAFLCLAMMAHAVPASPEPFLYTMPDGTEVMAVLHGDEFHSYITDMDGNLLEGTIAPSEMEMSAIRRAKADRKGAGDNTYPSKGSPRSIVLLFGYSDEPFAQSKEDFDKLLNQSGYSYDGANGSCRDYYIASSDSIFQPQFDVYGPFQLSKTSKQYTDAQPKYGTDALAEAVGLAEEAGVDFSLYDENNDGVVDNIFFYYAGHNQAEGAGSSTIWPHQGSLANRGIVCNGKSIASYACTSEYRGSKGTTRCGVGTFCHEFGHVLGQPDFYDTEYNYYSVGNWDVMCSGNYNNQGRTPPTFSAYERFYMGWLTPIQLSAPGIYSMASREEDGEAYMIAASQSNLNGRSPSPSEFFLLEYRDGTGWDKYLPGHGMVVWHIDYSSSAWGSNCPNNGPKIMRMHMEEANGITWQQRANGESGRASDTYPGRNNVTAFNPVLHNGTALGTPVFNITELTGSVEFVYISMGGSSLRLDKEAIDLVTTVNDEGKIEDWTPETFQIMGSSLDPAEPFTVSVAKPFYIYSGESHPIRTSSAWKQSLTVTPQADSTINQTIFVSYVPTKRSCNSVTRSLSIKSNSAVTQVMLTGTAPRPTYVDVPQLQEPSNITPNSFTANWTSVPDAERYYLTLYSLTDGTSSIVQGFENFGDPIKVQLEGWKTTTNQTTTAAKSEGTRALLLQQSGDQITSPIYPAALTGISYWLNAMASDRDTLGYITIEAFNGEEWIELDETYVTKTTKKKNVSTSLDVTQNYIGIRLTYESFTEANVALDAFTVNLSKELTYISKGQSTSIEPTTEETVSHLIKDLQPSTTYFVQVQATDLDKGCDEHLTELSEPQEIKTPAANLDEKKLMLYYDDINFAAPTLVVCLPDPQDGDLINYYDVNGHLVFSQPVTANETIYVVPLTQLKKGDIYIVTHAIGGKLKRHQKSNSFLY